MNVNRTVQIIGFGIVALIVIAFSVFAFSRVRNNPSPSSQKPQQQSTKKLSDYSTTNAAVSFIVEGKTNGGEQHREVRVNVDKFNRSLLIFEGYQGKIIRQENFPNSEQGYKEFLAALEKAGFSVRREGAKTISPDGQCSLGKRYYYQATEVAGFPADLWSSSCGRAVGTFGGNFSVVQQLFQLQIPDYSKLTQDVKF